MRLTRGLAQLREALPAGLASLWALMLGHSVSGVGARGLARVRERVLTEAEIQSIVPEPGTLSLLALGGLLLASRRRQAR